MKPRPSAPLWKRVLRRFLKLCALVVLAFVLFVAWANVAPMIASRGRLFKNPAEVPHHKTGLIFGCDPKIEGRENLYFRDRVDAAAALWSAGKVDRLIVSGYRSKYYNEPEALRQALIARGVPAAAIIPDYGGLRTLDSVVRAKEVFGVTEVVFISQRFQNERAIYLARANGISAIGLDTRDLSGGVREIGARVKMWLDVRILSTRPKFPTEKVDLPENH